MEAVDILGGKTAIEKTLREKLGMPDLNLAEMTKFEVIDLITDHDLELRDVFVVGAEDLRQWKEECKILSATGGDDNIALLSIVFDTLAELCKPKLPLTPEQVEEIRELRKKYRLPDPETASRSIDEEKLAEQPFNSSFRSRYRDE